MGKSNSEVGHVKNMANYNEAIIILQEWELFTILPFQQYISTSCF